MQCLTSVSFLGSFAYLKFFFGSNQLLFKKIKTLQHSISMDLKKNHLKEEKEEKKKNIND